ncbi:hypothetical protein FI667_g7663, partial [Globisporangium splendens]
MLLQGKSIFSSAVELISGLLTIPEERTNTRNRPRAAISLLSTSRARLQLKSRHFTFCPLPHTLSLVMDPLALELELDTITAAGEPLTVADLSFLFALTTERPSSANSSTKHAWSLTEDLESGDDGRLHDDLHSILTTSLQWDGDIDDQGLKKASTPAVTMTPAKKQRKRWSEANREAKQKLKEEVRYLEARAALLRHETGATAPQVIKGKCALGEKLRDAVLQQDLQLAATQSMFSGFMNSRAMNPLDSYIHLTADWQQRRDALLEMKDRKLGIANSFLVERTRFVDPFLEYSEQSQYVTGAGEYCTIKMDTTPFEGVSLRQVFDAMHFFFMNLEITLTDMSGNVTIRENDENTETTVLQHRLVTSERDGVLVEKNVVLFFDASGLDCDNVDDQNAVITVDYVDQDDLYPYRLSERIRKDATCAMKLSVHRRKREGVAPFGNDGVNVDEEDEVVVVLTRWFHVQLRRPEIEISESVVRSIADSLMIDLDHIVNSMKDGVYPTKSVAQ